MAVSEFTPPGKVSLEHIRAHLRTLLMDLDFIEDGDSYGIIKLGADIRLAGDQIINYATRRTNGED
jgi:hypothetical protein